MGETLDCRFCRSDYIKSSMRTLVESADYLMAINSVSDDQEARILVFVFQVSLGPRGFPA